MTPVSRVLCTRLRGARESSASQTIFSNSLFSRFFHSFSIMWVHRSLSRKQVHSPTPTQGIGVHVAVVSNTATIIFWIFSCAFKLTFSFIFFKSFTSLWWCLSLLLHVSSRPDQQQLKRQLCQTHRFTTIKTSIDVFTIKHVFKQEETQNFFHQWHCCIERFATIAATGLANSRFIYFGQHETNQKQGP